MQAKKPAGAGSVVPNGNQGTLYADDFVKRLDTRYPGRPTHTTAPLILSLDNEPDLWGSTHPEIRGRAPGNKEVFIALNLTGQDELVSKSIVIVINKSQTTSINTGFQVAHTVRFDKAEVYQITGGVGTCTGPMRQADIPITLKNAFTIALPPLSISTSNSLAL